MKLLRECSSETSTVSREMIGSSKYGKAHRSSASVHEEASLAKQLDLKGSTTTFTRRIPMLGKIPLAVMVATVLSTMMGRVEAESACPMPIPDGWY